MVKMAEYKQIEKLYESNDSLVYRRGNLVLKILKNYQNCPKKVASFKREYQISNRLNYQESLKLFAS